MFRIPDQYRVFSLKFKALKPQSEWESSPLYTTRKFSGSVENKDLSISSTNGIMVVYRLKSGIGTVEKYVVVYPNPTTGDISFKFDVEIEGVVELYINDMSGKIVRGVINRQMSAGKYVYTDNIGSLSSGVYVASLFTNNNKASVEIVKK
jgi:hypothetical protein